MSITAPVAPEETTRDDDYSAMVEFCLLGLRAEVQRAREAVRSRDDEQLAAARAQARWILSHLRVLP